MFLKFITFCNVPEKWQSITENFLIFELHGINGVRLCVLLIFLFCTFFLLSYYYTNINNKTTFLLFISAILIFCLLLIVSFNTHQSFLIGDFCFNLEKDVVVGDEQPTTVEEISHIPVKVTEQVEVAESKPGSDSTEVGGKQEEMFSSKTIAVSAYILSVISLTFCFVIFFAIIEK